MIFYPHKEGGVYVDKVKKYLPGIWWLLIVVILIWNTWLGALMLIASLFAGYVWKIINK